jgi:hypothetical protein
MTRLIIKKIRRTDLIQYKDIYPDLLVLYDEFLDCYKKSPNSFGDNYKANDQKSSQIYFNRFIKYLTEIISEQEYTKDKCTYLNLLFTFLTKYLHIVNLNVYRKKFRKAVVDKALEFYSCEDTTKESKEIIDNFLIIMDYTK